ncbi:MAG: Spy/CpxP family protein refolding chaperone [Leptolyngbya sp. SIO1D8]|nr:Spy/CpxP family protein refolding chaperone [Leptolyngbya sp. SIO1D8]
MMKRTVTTLIAAGLMLPVVGIFAASQLQAQTEPPITDMLLAQQGDRPGLFEGAGRGDRAERLIQELELTEDQVTQIQAIREGSREEMRALHDNLRANHETLHGLMASDATEAELRAQHEEIQTLHIEVADKRFETMLAIRGILTPEQRSELAELMEQRREEFRENRGFRGNREERREGRQ